MYICVFVFPQTLVKVSSQCAASYQEAEAKYNTNKNRFQDMLPSESIMLLSGFSGCTSERISFTVTFFPCGSKTEKGIQGL